MLSVFFKKAVRKLNWYGKRLIGILRRLPRRCFAWPAVKSIGPIIAGTKKETSAPSIKRDKPHLLILRNRSYSKGSNQISTEKIHLDNTLEASNLATFEVLTYDQDLLVSPIGDLQVIKRCRDVRPDAVILSSWWSELQQPSIHSLKFIRERLTVPIAALWWDTCTETFWRELQPFMEHFDVHALMDNPAMNFVERHHRLFNRVIPLWAPQREDFFCSSATRDIPVSFLGQVSSYRSYRKEVIDYMIAQQIPGCFQTNNRKTQVTHLEYVELMGRSKIALNFSYSVACHQLKARVFEAMFAGAMLLESENDQISLLFTPMKDYVPFTSKEDLVNKIRFYLENEDKLVEIAQHGRATAVKNYNANRFWQLLLGKLKLPLPECHESCNSYSH